jgi:hypothetical protein
MNQGKAPPRTLSKSQAGISLGLPIRTITTMIQDGRLKTLDLPGMKRPRVTQESVDVMYESIYGETVKA